MSAGGRRRRSFSIWVRTEEFPSRIRGKSFGRMTAAGSGSGSFTGWEDLARLVVGFCGVWKNVHLTGQKRESISSLGV